MTRLSVSTLVSALLLTSATAAVAQPAASPPPPPPGYGYAPPPPSFGVVRREGFLIGFSLGGGAFSLADCDDCESMDGVALDLHLGGMLTPRLALMFDGSGVAHSLEGGGSLVHVIDTVAAQYWVHPRVWLKGGLGFG